MRTDGYLPAGRGVAQPLARERVAAMLAGRESSTALNTLDECDEMAAGSDQITHDESELLQSESLAARALDQDLADGLRRRRPGGETSSGGICASSATGRGFPGRWSGGSSRLRRQGIVARARSWSRRFCR